MVKIDFPSNPPASSAPQEPPIATDVLLQLQRVVSASELPGNKVVVDAIYSRVLDEKTPFGSSERSLSKLKDLLASALDVQQDNASDMAATGFLKITRAPGGMYRIETGSGRQILSTREETELHVLLQTQVRQAEEGHQDHGDSFGPEIMNDANVESPFDDDFGDGDSFDESGATFQPNPSLSANATAGSVGTGAYEATFPARPENGQAVQRGQGNDTSVHAERILPTAEVRTSIGTTIDYSDPYEIGSLAHTFTNEEIEMRTIVSHLQDSTAYGLKKISAEGNNCWWRNGMLAVLLQCEPAALEETLREKLASGYEGEVAEDSTTLRKMAESAQSGNLYSILTRTQDCQENNALDVPSRLKLPEVSDAQDNGQGEEVCKRVLKHLLRSFVDNVEVINSAFDNPNTINGDNCYLMYLMNQLQCSCVFFNKGQPLDDKGRLVFDPARSTVDISATIGADLSTVEQTAVKTLAAENLRVKLGPTPVLVLAMGHIDLLIPKCFFPND